MPTTASRSAGRPRDSNGERTRALLIDAAIEMFSRQGLARTTLRDIAEAANLSGGTLYHYFNSKADLYRAAYLWAIEDQFTDMRAAIRGKRTVRSRMVAVIERNYERSFSKPQVMNFVLRAWVEHNAEDQQPLPVPDYVGELYDAIIGDGVENGEVSAGGAQRVIDALRCMQWGISALAVTGRSPKEAVEGLKAFVADPLARV
ncbi:TetR/AcrR family transcriptional regulator [Cumulibacter soli]|uniref:TetR/AcrR family transcriptional regulator n=1 Tax=Cumulibacter soli TaxID=2546344 RepID=UPI0014196EF2|nr:TetR/AcrR family transcriptional regulator [Cumulibacter soli]